MAERKNVVFAVKMLSKFPPKQGGYSYLCEIEGSDCYLDVQEPLETGMTYIAAKIANLERRGKAKKLYGQASGVKLQGGTKPAGLGAPPANGTGYPPEVYLKLDGLIAKAVQPYADNEGELKAKAYACMWVSMSKDAICLGALREQEKPSSHNTPAPDAPPDELPPDEDIPF